MKLIKYLCISVFLYCCFTIGFPIYKATKSFEPSFPRITNQYTEVFSEKALRSIQPYYTFFIKYKNPIATFNTNDGQYRLIVYKFNNVTDKISVPDLIKLKWNAKNTELTTDALYTIIKTRDFSLSDASREPMNVNGIYLSSDTAPYEKPIITDSLVKYSFFLSKFSARYTPASDVEIYLKKLPTAYVKDIKLNLMFLRKNNKLYMLILSLNNSSQDHFDENLLYKLVTEK